MSRIGRPMSYGSVRTCGPAKSAVELPGRRSRTETGTSWLGHFLVARRRMHSTGIARCLALLVIHVGLLVMARQGR